MANWPKDSKDRVELKRDYFNKTIYTGGSGSAYAMERDPNTTQSKKMAEDWVEKMKARFEKTLVALGCRKSMTTDDGDGILKLDAGTGTEFINVLTALGKDAESVGVLEFHGSGAKQATYASQLRHHLGHFSRIS